MIDGCMFHTGCFTSPLVGEVINELCELVGEGYVAKGKMYTFKFGFLH